MKISIGHAVSLGFNVIFTAVLIVQWVDRRNERRTVLDAQEGAPVAASGATLEVTPSPASPTSRLLPNRVVLGGGWRAWLEPLRLAGVPTPVLVTLVREDFDRRWQAKAAEAQRKYRQGQLDADGLALSALDHDADLEKETREALGDEAYRRWDMDSVLESFNLNDVSLSPAERTAIYECQRRLREDSRNAQAAKLQGKIDQATFESRQHTAEEESAAILRTVLGDRRASVLQGTDTMDDVKRNLSGLPMSDGQLQELANLQQCWDKTHSDLSALETSTQDTKYTEALREAEVQWRTKLEQILGSDGAQQYLRAQDSRYIEMKRFAKDWKLSPAEIDRVYDTIADFEDTVREYSRDARGRDVDSLSLENAMKQFAQRTERSLQTTLGPKRYQQLELNGIALTVGANN